MQVGTPKRHRRHRIDRLLKSIPRSRFGCELVAASVFDLKRCEVTFSFSLRVYPAVDGGKDGQRFNIESGPAGLMSTTLLDRCSDLPSRRNARCLLTSYIFKKLWINKSLHMYFFFDLATQNKKNTQKSEADFRLGIRTPNRGTANADTTVCQLSASPKMRLGIRARNWLHLFSALLHFLH